MYKYQLPMMDRGDFDELYGFVRQCFRVSKARLPELSWIDTNESVVLGLFPSYFRDKGSPLACTVAPVHNYNHFQVWVSPAHAEDNFRFRTTLVHELCHGFAGLQHIHMAW